MNDKIPIKKNKDNIDWYSLVNNVVSTNECTGLIPTPQISESQSESYIEILDVPIK